MARDPKNLVARLSEKTEVVEGNVFKPETLTAAQTGIRKIIYRAHRKTYLSMSAAASKTPHSSGFSHVAMSNLRLMDVPYLGGLGKESRLSKHLASRQEEGRILNSGKVPCIEFRASIVIGSGSL